MKYPIEFKLKCNKVLKRNEDVANDKNKHELIVLIKLRMKLNIIKFFRQFFESDILISVLIETNFKMNSF